MPRTCWALLFLIALLPATAAASPSTSWVAADLPMGPGDHHALVPLEAPSKAHPLGTVAIVGHERVVREGNDDNLHIVWAYAWDLATKRVIAKKRLGRTEDPLPVVAAVRAGDQIFVVAGANDNLHPAEVVLFTVDEALDVVARDVLGRGTAPSVAVSDPWIVAGFFEERTTDVLSLNPDDPPLHQAFHAVVLDRTTHAVAGARVFQGRRLMAPDFRTRSTLRAIALRDGRAYLSLPGWGEALIVSAKLPSLATVKTRLIDGFQVASGSAPIYSVDRHIVVVTPQGWRVLSPELALITRLQSIGFTMAWNPRTATLLESSSQGNGLPWNVLHIDDCNQLVWASNRPVAMCDGDEDSGTPMRIFYRR